MTDLMRAIVARDSLRFAELLERTPELASATFEVEFFSPEIGYQFYTGDTALHVAAAAHEAGMVTALLRAGAEARARNRRGCQPLHSAAVGSPGAARWNPVAQVATIAALLAGGADVNARNMDGATPLHRAVRTRCSGAVRALLEHGADPAIRNKAGSTALDLARHTSGRSGAGSAEARAEREVILAALTALR